MLDMVKQEILEWTPIFFLFLYSRNLISQPTSVCSPAIVGFRLPKIHVRINMCLLALQPIL